MKYTPHRRWQQGEQSSPCCHFLVEIAFFNFSVKTLTLLRNIGKKIQECISSKYNHCSCLYFLVLFYDLLFAPVFAVNAYG